MASLGLAAMEPQPDGCGDLSGRAMEGYAMVAAMEPRPAGHGDAAQADEELIEQIVGPSDGLPVRRLTCVRGGSGKTVPGSC